MPFCTLVCHGHFIRVSFFPIARPFCTVFTLLQTRYNLFVLSNTRLSFYRAMKAKAKFELGVSPSTLLARSRIISLNAYWLLCHFCLPMRLPFYPKSCRGSHVQNQPHALTASVSHIRFLVRVFRLPYTFRGASCPSDR